MNSVDRSAVRHFEIKRFENGTVLRTVDTVAAEEPLGIFLQYWIKDSQTTTSIALAMRTPGHDRELVAGYLLTEGLISRREDLVDLRPIGPSPSNEMLAELAPQVDVDAWKFARSTFLGSSCGICGKRSLDAIGSQVQPLLDSGLVINPGLIESLPDLLSHHQEGFAETGGLHAAALISAQGALTSVFEDIGRHNALDKLIGEHFLQGNTPLTNSILLLSSRSSFELIQKAAMAGAPVVATVGGPSSLSIEAARQFGITLIGFVRDRRFNVYSGDWRLHS